MNVFCAAHLLTFFILNNSEKNDYFTWLPSWRRKMPINPYCSILVSHSIARGKTSSNTIKRIAEGACHNQTTRYLTYKMLTPDTVIYFAYAKTIACKVHMYMLEFRFSFQYRTQNAKVYIFTACQCDGPCTIGPENWASPHYIIHQK